MQQGESVPTPLSETSTEDISKDWTTWEVSVVIIFFWRLVGKPEHLSARKMVPVTRAAWFSVGRVDVQGSSLMLSVGFT